MTPIGSWPIRAALLRPDRVALPAGVRLPWRWLRPDEGWSDDPVDPAYNRPVRHPHRYSAERLWREDGLYDVIVTLGHNDAPIMAGLGSAIFLHCGTAGSPTEGCVAIAVEELVALLPLFMVGDEIGII
jgi:L,D-peptidoglycan transpeptidase YkuD (ErfK/YbiS/YcfS/YnhG family)